MPYKCVVAGCSERPEPRKRSVHQIPFVDGVPDRRWERFVQVWRVGWTATKSSYICSDHFTSMDYYNYTQFTSGFAKKLELRPNAFPSVHPSKERRDALRKKIPANPSGKTSSGSKPTSSRKAVTKLGLSRRLADLTPVQECVDIPAEFIKEEAPAPVGDVFLAQHAENDKGTQWDWRPTVSSRSTQVNATWGLHDQECQANLCNLPPLDFWNKSEHTDDVPMSSDDEADEPDDELDPDWRPDMDSEGEEMEEDSTHSLSLKVVAELPVAQQPKYVVYASSLLDLFNSCPLCHQSTNADITRSVGTFIQIEQKCNHCGHARQWQNQPLLREKLPAGNLHLAASILFSGSLPQQSLRMLKIFDLKCFNRSTYFQHQIRRSILPRQRSANKENDAQFVSRPLPQGSRGTVAAGQWRSPDDSVIPKARGGLAVDWLGRSEGGEWRGVSP